MIIIKNIFFHIMTLGAALSGITFSAASQSAYDKNLQQQLIPEAATSGYLGMKFADFSRKFRVSNFRMETNPDCNCIAFHYPFTAGNADSVHYYFQDDYRFHFSPFKIVDSTIRIAGSRFFYHSKGFVDSIARKLYGRSYMDALKKKPASDIIIFQMKAIDKKSNMPHEFDIRVNLKKEFIDIKEPILLENWFY